MSHGPALVQCHCGTTIPVHHVWAHLRNGHQPAQTLLEPSTDEPVDWASLPAERKEPTP